MDRIKIGITQGDINGIGYEVILKTFAEPQMMELCTPILYGNAKVATYYRKTFDVNTNFTVITSAANAQPYKLSMIHVGEEDPTVTMGKPTTEAGQAALAALEAAVADFRDGNIDALVTAPINKHTLQSDTFHFAGHTEYIAERLGEGATPLMILMSGDLRVALVTTHLAVKEIATAITQPIIEDKIAIFNQSLRNDFTIRRPRIAVLALNPHAGDDGTIGDEEQQIIIPAIKNMTARGIQCFGPFAADGFFGSDAYNHYDGILAMYHDQGLAPFKALAMDSGVNYTAGLPIVRTSPAHGTGYDIAGQGIASEESFRQAIYAAIDIYRHRQTNAEIQANPLRKQYHDRRDDSDKLKLDATTDDTF